MEFGVFYYDLCPRQGGKWRHTWKPDLKISWRATKSGWFEVSFYYNILWVTVVSSFPWWSILVLRLPSKVFARTTALGKIMTLDNLWNDISLLLIGVACARRVWNHLSTCYSIVKWLLISRILCVFFGIFCVILKIIIEMLEC